MSVLSVSHVAELEEENGDGELIVVGERRKFTLACDWPECKAEFTGVQRRGFLSDAGWRCWGSGKKHLCPDHRHHPDES